MRNHRLTLCLAAVTLLFITLPIYTVHCQNYYEYQIEVRGDGTALWRINQFSSADAPVETWEGYQQKIFDLGEAAANTTNRPMDVDENSLQIDTTLSMESKITEYTFVWRNFSVLQDGKLVLGDVFGVPDFFGHLFGDAALMLSYPEGFAVESVYPEPHQRQDQTHTMEWVRTEELANTHTQIVLTPDIQSNSSNSWPLSFIVLAVSAVGISVSLLGFYSYRRRKSNGKTAPTQLAVPPALETEEDKILNLLKTQGGTMKQSEITERLGFSKAKTSQLLTALESKGILARYKKGRDKIVTIEERGKGE